MSSSRSAAADTCTHWSSQTRRRLRSWSSPCHPVSISTKTSNDGMFVVLMVYPAGIRCYTQVFLGMSLQRWVIIFCKDLLLAHMRCTEGNWMLRDLQPCRTVLVAIFTLTQGWHSYSQEHLVLWFLILLLKCSSKWSIIDQKGHLNLSSCRVSPLSLAADLILFD